MATHNECPAGPPAKPPNSGADAKQKNKDHICNTLMKDESATAPFDPRFPNQNQTRYCYQMYVDYFRCAKVRGESHEACQYFERNYHSLCPNEWIATWDEKRANCIFPGTV